MSEQLQFGKRSYVMHVPSSYDGKQPVSLVIVLHPGLGNAAVAAQMTGMSAKADKEGFLVVYPQGTGFFKNRFLTWNAGYCCGYAARTNVDDVQFLKELIEYLRNTFNIDRDRIYATGMSNGAMMAYRLACELSDVIAAVAPVAGSYDIRNCHPHEPVSLIAFHGLKDKRVRFEGGKPIERADPSERVDVAVAEVISFWARQNGCLLIPEREETETIFKETYREAGMARKLRFMELSYRVTLGLVGRR